MVLHGFFDGLPIILGLLKMLQKLMGSPSHKHYLSNARTVCLSYLLHSGNECYDLMSLLKNKKKNKKKHSILFSSHLCQSTYL